MFRDCSACEARADHSKRVVYMKRPCVEELGRRVGPARQTATGANLGKNADVPQPSDTTDERPKCGCNYINVGPEFPRK